MPLVTTKEMFEKAYNGGYAVGAFNVNNMEIVQGITEAAGELKSPVILQVSKGARAYANHTYLVKLVEAAVAENPEIPIALHLDHGDTFELCKSCIDGGFTSVMIDASHEPFEDNVAVTKRVVELAHPLGVSVEAELGTIGSTDNDTEVAGGAMDIIYTKPEEAVRFVEETDCDCLAIAIGTAHGLYPKGFKPELKLDLLKEIKKVVSVPLVLHGGSGNPDKEIGEAAKLGINKINISSDIKDALYQKLRVILANDLKVREPFELYPEAINAMKEVARHKMKLFGSDDKVKYYVNIPV